MKKIKTPPYLCSLLCCLLLFSAPVSCKNDTATSATEVQNMKVFNPEGWRMQKEGKYIYRDLMLEDVVYNDTIRSLDKKNILELLGEPDRVEEKYFYYKISEKRLGSWTLHQKSMVIKFKDEYSIEWIKIHQ